MLDDDPIYDVLIAGAGPTGLLLASELRLGSCTVLVLEQAPDPHSPLKAMPFGLRGLTVPTIESFDRRGLLDALRRAAARDTAASAHPEQHRRRPGGHFAGIDFFNDEVGEEVWSRRMSGGIETLAVDMATIERVLAERAEALGVQVRRGAAVAGVTQRDDIVVVDTGGGRHRGRWLVGCDGGRSTVRKAAGIGFAGTEPEFTGYSVQAALADPTQLKPGRILAPWGVYIFAPPDTIWMADFDRGAAHRTVPLTRERVEATLRKVSGTAVAITVLRLATTWTDRAYLATQYRKDRVLLAGDAAHVHSPLGGQGLNLGIGDAINLGWKLAAVARGDAPADFLDSYEAERRPVAAEVLDRSRAQVALLRPDPGSRALEAILRDLIETRDGTTYFAQRVSGIDQRYELHEAHPLVGRSAPDFILKDGTRVNERLRHGRGVLLAFAGDPMLRTSIARGHDRIDKLEGLPREHSDLTAALIRPDGVVAWASDKAVDAAGLEQAIARWFGVGGLPPAGGDVLELDPATPEDCHPGDLDRASAAISRMPVGSPG